MLKRVRRKPGEPPPHYVVDRRMPEPCWLIDRPVVSSYQATAWLIEAVGERGPGELFQHLCEIALEPNRCVNPAHIVIGTKSTNALHAHAMRRAAGRPWTGGRRKGERMGPYKSEPWKCHCGWAGKRNGATLHRQRAHGEMGPVPPSAP